MQTQTKYGIIKNGIIEVKKLEFPLISLLRVPHKNSKLVVSWPAFGPKTYSDNIQEMQKFYSHPQTGEKIFFREPTTSESISAAAYVFENIAKPQILDPRWLELGRILRTSQGVYVNPPKDAKDNSVTDEKTLESFLNKTKKVNGIYLCDNDFGFAPYETFKQGKQDCDEFTEGGLARVLEHTGEKKAQKLGKIASPEFYKDGVYVWGFDKVKEPFLTVVSLFSNWDLGNYRLLVYGNWCDYDKGYVFGILKN